MLSQIPLVQSSRISLTSNTIIKFDNNEIEFTVVPQSAQGDDEYIFKIQDIKGNFKFDKISLFFSSKMSFDKKNNTFIVESENIKSIFYFHILANINLLKLSYVSVTYQLQIPSARLRKLKFYEYFEEEIILPNYEYLKFRCLIKKIHEHQLCIVIENPYKIEIDGKTGDHEYFHGTGNNDDLDLKLAFVFDPKNIPHSNKNSQSCEKVITAMAKNLESLTIQCPALEESRPPSVLPSLISTQVPASTTPLEAATYTPHLIPTTTKFFETFSIIQNYPDVNFISCDGIEIPSYRCILAFHSEIFKNIFEAQKEIPVQIKSKSFEAKIISAALNFCYGKAQSFVGNESKLYDYATKYGINELKVAYCSFMEANVSHKNVCEFIQIAYSNNLETLKQKCYQVLKKNINKIHPQKIKKLPNEILVDIFYNSNAEQGPIPSSEYRVISKDSDYLYIEINGTIMKANYVKTENDLATFQILGPASLEELSGKNVHA